MFRSVRRALPGFKRQPAFPNRRGECGCEQHADDYRSERDSEVARRKGWMLQRQIACFAGWEPVALEVRTVYRLSAPTFAGADPRN
jgi:hypothetical protein